MPCYQVQTASCEMGEHTDTQLLEKALQEEGYETQTPLVNAHTGKKIETLTFSKPKEQIYGTFQKGRLHVTSPAGTKVDTDSIKRSYSREALKAKAKKHGFKVEQKPGNRFILSKIANNF